MNLNATTASSEIDRSWPKEIDSLPLPCIEMDASGLITRANRAAHALHHPGHGDLVGTLAWDLLATDEKDLSHAEFFAHMQSGGDPPVITRNIFDRSGSFRTYQFHRCMIRDGQQNPAGMRMLAVDITEMKQTLDEAHRSLHWLQNAMQSLTEAVFLIDTLGVVRSMNAAAETLSGFRAAEFIGKTIEEISPMIHYQPLDEFPFSHRAAIERPCRGIATLLNRNRQQVKVEMSTSPIIDKQSGSVAGVVALLRKVEADRSLL
jgi:PAS domain S-box-containing protein